MSRTRCYHLPTGTGVKYGHWNQLDTLIRQRCHYVREGFKNKKKKLSWAGPGSAKVEFSGAFLLLNYAIVHLNFWENSSLQLIEISLTRMKFLLRRVKFSLKRIKFYLKRTKFSLKRLKFSLNRMKFSIERIKFSIKRIKFSIKRIKFSLERMTFFLKRMKFSSKNMKLLP